MSQPKSSRRRFGVLTIAVGVVVTLMAVMSTPAFAVHDLKFQLDGNTAVDSGTSQPFDWESFFKASTTDGTIAKAVNLPNASFPDFTASGFATSGGKAGDFYLPDETTFATGSKDTLNISNGWQCGKSNNVGDKVDILNAYSAVYVNPGNQHTILYFGVEKSSPNGDSNIAVWFLQDGSVACDATGGSNVNFTGNHQDGDLLLVSAFTNGGLQANVAAYKWNGGAGGSLGTNPVATGGLCPAASTADPAGQNACAITNATTPINPPWKHPDKDCCGHSNPNPELNPLEFFEGGVDLTAAGINDACFANFLANTRSSQSLTATIFDFAEGSLQTCAPSTDLSVSASKTQVHSGETSTITIHEINDGINPLTSPSVSVTSSTSQNCSTPTKTGGDTNNNGVLDVNEDWTFTCTIAPTSDVTLTFTGHGLDPLGRDVTFDSTKCAGKTNGQPSNDNTIVCDSDEVGTVSIDVINPSTDLTAKVVATFTFFEKNDGDVVLTSPSLSATGCDTGSLAQVFKTGSTTVNVGDTNSDGKLDPLEVWRWTCTATLNSSGSQTVNAVGSGVDPTGKTVTFCVTSPTSLCDSGEDATGGVSLNSNADPS